MLPDDEPKNYNNNIHNNKFFFDHDEMLKLGLSAFPNVKKEENNRNVKKMQAQMAVKYVFKKTESNSVDEFIERFKQNQVLCENLSNQRLLLDSRLSQLQLESLDLQVIWNDASLSEKNKNTEKNQKTTTTTTNNETNVHVEVEDNKTKKNEKNKFENTDVKSNISKIEKIKNEDRYLDNKVFSHEVRCHQLQRLHDKAVQSIHEIRTAVAHLMEFLVMNMKLLQALPKSKPPSLVTNDDVLKCLMWCEDRITALNETLSMEANRPTGANTTDDSQSISQRQVELAHLILNMKNDKFFSSNFSKHHAANKNNANNKKQSGGMSKNLITSAYDAKQTFVSPLSSVMITSTMKVDKNFDTKVVKINNERDKKTEIMEAQETYTAQAQKKQNRYTKIFNGRIGP